jgi:AraC-like DNA-binding protein
LTVLGDPDILFRNSAKFLWLMSLTHTMPIQTNSKIIDPDLVPRPVLAVGFEIVTRSMELDFHRHRKAQLLFMLRGAVTSEAAKGLWIVPSQCAIWIPGGMRHHVRGVGTLEGCCLFVEPDGVPALFDTCCAVSVTPLLRELLIRCAGLPALYPVGGTHSRLVTVLLDELGTAPVENLHLPMPADGRLRKIAQMMTAKPADRATMPIWAKRIGVSERTLSRILLSQTGMTFGRWRQQLHIFLALRWLSQGASVQSVAADLGYENASSFVTMFRKAMGTSPARYMTQRLTGSLKPSSKRSPIQTVV